MAALVLEGSTMLGLDVHVNSGLVLLGKGAVGALKLSVGRAQILESHFGDSICCGHSLQFFASLIKMQNSYLIASSTAFALPVTMCAYNRQWLAYSASVSILITSLIFHSTKDKKFMMLDIAAVYYLVDVFLWSAYTYKVLYFGIPVTSYTVLVYHYGYHNNALAWSPNHDESTFWHSTIHLAVALSAGYGSYQIGSF
jgi:hypothetical protein